MIYLDNSATTRTLPAAAEAAASRAAEAAASAEAAAERSNGRKLWDGLFSTAVGESPSLFMRYLRRLSPTTSHWGRS